MNAPQDQAAPSASDLPSARHHLQYWSIEQVASEIEDDDEEPWRHTAGAQLGRVSPGDVVWVVTFGARRPYLIARIPADQVVDDDEATAEGEGEGPTIPRRLTVPPNLFITGTVNIDETTYMFSAKVLDRAFTIEFNDVDLHGLGRPSIDGSFAGSTGEAIALTLPRLAETLTAPVPVGAGDWTAMRGLGDGVLADVILELHEALAPTNRHFGYRVANEIGRYMTLAAAQGDGSAGALRAALDLALMAKVLPKLHGTEAELGDLIDTLATLAHGHALPRMEQKLARMRRRLETQGFTSFIE